MDPIVVISVLGGLIFLLLIIGARQNHFDLLARVL